MSDISNNHLLKNRKVVEEINRHRWIESEKVGYDIGFEQASLDWLEKFSKAWMQYHMPNRTGMQTKQNKDLQKQNPDNPSGSLKTKAGRVKSSRKVSS